MAPARMNTVGFTSDKLKPLDFLQADQERYCTLITLYTQEKYILMVSGSFLVIK